MQTTALVVVHLWSPVEWHFSMLHSSSEVVVEAKREMLWVPVCGAPME